MSGEQFSFFSIENFGNTCFDFLWTPFEVEMTKKIVSRKKMTLAGIGSKKRMKSSVDCRVRT